jgi:large repetitive protein
MRLLLTACLVVFSCGLDLASSTTPPSVTPAPDSGVPEILVFGDGRDREGTAANIKETTQRYLTLTAAASVGDTTLNVDGPLDKFSEGDLLLLHRSTNVEGVTTGAPTSISAQEFLGVGQFAVLVLKGINSGTISVKTIDGGGMPFTVPYSMAYRSTGTQIVRIAQFTNVTLGATDMVEPDAWNGMTGGILAFVANGTVRNEGTLSASGKGYRGGREDLPTTRNSCDGEQGEISAGYAPRGEGPFQVLYTAVVSSDGGTQDTMKSEIAPASTGGGGGRCVASGGGGGGHAGGGGLGGKSAMVAPQRSGGQGGANVSYPQALAGQQEYARGYMMFGGGGGSGETTSPMNMVASNAGAPGGGILFVRAASIVGKGRWLSNGDNGKGDPSAESGRGGGGGGAGGTIDFIVQKPFQATEIAAKGGNGGEEQGTGGNETQKNGSGGGGGGGKIRLRAPGIIPQSNVSGGIPGLANATRAAQPGNPGDNMQL